MLTKPKYDYLDFFPDCCLPDCEQKETVHQHILPHQQSILDSTAKYIYVQGGVGSAKSIAFAAKAVYLSLTVSENEGVVCRKNYKDLYKSSWRDIKRCIRNLTHKGIISEPDYSAKTQGDYSKITFDNGSIIYAIQGKNWSDALGASYGWFWVDDAMESYEELFIGDETSAGLLGRLRLPNVHYNKATYDTVNREHGSLHGMVSSNPPPVGHYLHQLFGAKPGMHKLGDDTVEWIQTATHQNPFVGASYATGLMAIQAKMGRSQNVARRVIFGESIPAYGGVKVFPEFNHAKHVVDIKYDKDIPLVRGWDFGFHHPAVVFSHLYKCTFGTNHYLSISEVADCFSVNVWDLYKKVKEHTDTLYKDNVLILDAGDRAGYRKSDSNRDKRGPIRILQDEYNLKFLFRVLDLDNSLDYMRGLLDPKKPCRCNQEIIQVSPNCPVLIGALEGGYKYPKPRSGPVGNKPVEDRYFADIACSWRYGAENLVKWGIPFTYQGNKTVALLGGLNGHRKNEPWSWMEMSDQDMAKVLTR